MKASVLASILLAIYLILPPPSAMAQRNCWVNHGNAVALQAASPSNVIHAPSPQHGVPQPVHGVEWEWKQSGGDFHLFRFGSLVGGYSSASDAYYLWANGDWTPADSPIPIPASIRATGATVGKVGKVNAIPKAESKKEISDPGIGQVADPDPPRAAETFVSNDLPTGADWAKISKSPRVTYKGEVVSHDTAKGLIEGKKSPSDLVDDSAKDRLTFMATSKEKRTAAIRAFKGHPAYAQLRQAALAWEGDPQDWSFEPGFARADNQVVLQNAQGKVLARAQVDDVADPAQVIGAIRKARPDYDPAKDPTPVKPDGKSDGSIDLSSIPAEYLLLGAIGIFLLMLARR